MTKQREKFSNFEISDHLNSKEDIESLLNDAWLSGDIKYFYVALGEVVKAVGVSNVARKTGLSNQGIYKAIDPNSKPQFETISKIVMALGVNISFIMQQAS